MTIRDNVEHKQSWEEYLQSNMNPTKVITWDYRHLDKLETFWMSDVHWGHKACNKELVFQNLERIDKRQMPFADLGDLIENSNKTSIGSAQINFSGEQKQIEVTFT